MSTVDPTDLIEGVRYRITVEDTNFDGLVGTFVGITPDPCPGTEWSFGRLGPGAFVFEPYEPPTMAPIAADPWAVPTDTADRWTVPDPAPARS